MIKTMVIQKTIQSCVLAALWAYGAISGVRVEKSLTGLIVQGSKNARGENCIIANSRTGASLSGSEGIVVVVNNTLTREK